MTNYKINEIFNSIQGESNYSGYPTTFIRFTGCNLRCTYCDTKYAFYDGKKLSIDKILEKVNSYNSNYVCLTGGEPLEQNLDELIIRLKSIGKKVSIETNGSIFLENFKALDNVKIVMDLKTPSSKMADKNDFRNLSLLKKNDDIKFVCGTKEDFDYSFEIIKSFKLENRVNIIFSNIYRTLSTERLANWILESNLKEVRLQLQIHKYIWNSETRGV